MKTFKSLCVLIISIITGILFASCSNDVNIEKLIKEAEEKGYDTALSRCIVSDDGTIFFEYDGKVSEIHYYDNKHYLTDTLTTGDLVLLIGEPKFNSREGKYMRFKNCVLIEEGTVDDISDEMLEPLIERGFVDDILREKKGITLDTSNWQDVSYKDGIQSISLKLPVDWEYEIDTSAKDMNYGIFAIKFWPKGESGDISVGYCERYGICGTGLTSENLSAGPYRVGASTYGSYGNWEYIHIGGVTGNYEIDSHGASEWYDKHKETVENIFTTLAISEDIINFDEALEISYNLLCEQYSPEYDSYDGFFLDNENCWRFNYSYYPSEKFDTWNTVVITVYLDGTAEFDRNK